MRLSAPLTLGVRHEWWRAYGGVNFSAGPGLPALQPERVAVRFSPKASLARSAGCGWTVGGSHGDAWRFPTDATTHADETLPGAVGKLDPGTRPG